MSSPKSSLKQTRISLTHIHSLQAVLRAVRAACFRGAGGCGGLLLVENLSLENHRTALGPIEQHRAVLQRNSRLTKVHNG